MRPKKLQITPYDATDVDAICLTQTPSAGGIQELIINGTLETGGVAILDIPRQVSIEFSGDDIAQTIVVTGTDAKGNLLVEAVAGRDTTDNRTTHRFATVTSVKIDNDAEASLQVGTAPNDIVSTEWMPLDYLQTDFRVALGISFANTVTGDVTVELTLFNILDYQGWDVVPGRGQHVRSEFERYFPDHIGGLHNDANAQRHIFDHDSLVNVTDDATGNIAFPVRAVRMTSNSQMIGGSATSPGVELEVIQASHRSG